MSSTKEDDVPPPTTHQISLDDQDDDDVPAEIPAVNVLDGLFPVARLPQSTETTTRTIASSQGPWTPGQDEAKDDREYYYEVKATLKHDAAEDVKLLKALNVQIGKKLTSEFCEKLVASLQDANFLYLVTEFHTAGTLEGFAVTSEDATFYIGCLAVALEHCRIHGVVHRDVSSANARIDAQGYVVITNFEKAAILEEPSGRLFSLVTTVPAPECVDGDGYDCAIDWWGLGCLAFELVTGFHPALVEKSRLYTVVSDAANGKFPGPTAKALQDASDAFTTFVTSLLASRSRRPSTLADIQDHPYLAALDWTALQTRHLTPPAGSLLKQPRDPLHRLAAR